MTATATNLTVRPLVDADLPEVLGLLGAALAGGPTGRRTADFFRWKHQDNPFGRSFGLVAEADGRVVGVRLFLRWELHTGAGGKRPVRAVRAVDTATHPEHQGRGIFRTLTLSALEQLRADTDLVFNTPNSNSRPGYLKMGWQSVGTVPIAVRPVRPMRFARHYASAARGDAPSGTSVPRPDRVVECPLPPAAAAFAPGSGLAEVLEEAEATRLPGQLRTRRSVDYLRWRYADVPDLDYRVVGVERGGRLRGLAFARPRLRGELRELTLAELVIPAGDHRTLRQLLSRAARRSGCDHVATHLPAGRTTSAAALAAGYLGPPGVGMGLVARPLREHLAPDPLQLRSWAFSLGDLEVF
jgi:GNAT superfamily N-acetyltransferase